MIYCIKDKDGNVVLQIDEKGTKINNATITQG
ncbi:hypothetical protein M948_18285 [Virgibacillus sp. CM-4]|nr:hypothetical protein M948_18285 [Virgibacillus sp. CM-4]